GTAGRGALGCGPDPPLAARRVVVRLAVALFPGRVVRPRSLRVDFPLEGPPARTGRAVPRHRLRPVLLTPLPRRRERRTPHASPGRLRRRLVRDVVRGVAAIGERPALADQPRADVLSGDATYRHRAPVPIRVPRPAGEGTATDVVGQRVRRRLAAAPVATVAQADLPAFRSVDAVEPDRLVVDLDGVAVAYRRDARDRVASGSCRTRQEQPDRAEARGKPPARRARCRPPI